MDSDPTMPVAEDDFAEFAAPPKQRPRSIPEPRHSDERPLESNQDAVDKVLARLRRERAEGKH